MVHAWHIVRTLSLQEKTAGRASNDNLFIVRYSLTLFRSCAWRSPTNSGQRATSDRVWPPCR